MHIILRNAFIRSESIHVELNINTSGHDVEMVIVIILNIVMMISCSTAEMKDRKRINGGEMIILGNKTLKGNKNLKTLEIETSTFDKITNKTQGDIKYYKSDGYRAVLIIDENLIEYFTVTTKDNELVFKQEPGFNYKPSNCLLEVYAPTISKYHLKGSGDFKTNDTIETENFDISIDGSGDCLLEQVLSNNLNLEINGSGDIKIKTTTNNAAISIKGSGDIDISGSSQKAVVNIKGSGDIEADDFIVESAVVSIFGSGDVIISVEKELDVSIFGSGDIKYIGSPVVRSKISGSGDIKQKR